MIVSTVNTPDFFARAKVYEDYKVYVACEEKRIIASAACALRNIMVNNQAEKIGHGFQAFVHPEYRGRRIVGQLHQVCEEYLIKQGAVLSYGLIMEGNIPSMRHVRRQGIQQYRHIVMPGIVVFQKMAVPFNERIRLAKPEDYSAIANLLNKTWQEHEICEPVTTQALERLITGTPGYSHENMFVLEDNGEIVACLGFLDWSQVMQITVKAISSKIRLMGLMLDALRLFRPLPQGPRPGDILKQMVLAPIGYQDVKYMAMLFRHINNEALSRGIQQIFFLCEQGQPLLSSLKGFIHIDTALYLFTKPLRAGLAISSRPLFVNSLDM